MEQGAVMEVDTRKGVDPQKPSCEDLIRANKFNRNVEQLVKRLEGELNPIYKNWKDVEDWVTPEGEINENISYPYVHSDSDFDWEYDLSADDVAKIRVVYRIDRETERYKSYLRQIYRSHIRAIEGWRKDRKELNELKCELKVMEKRRDEWFYACKEFDERRNRVHLDDKRSCFVYGAIVGATIVGIIVALWTIFQGVS